MEARPQDGHVLPALPPKGRRHPVHCRSGMYTRGEEENDVDMEYDGYDGRLWIRQNFLYTLSDLFGKNYVDTMVFVGKFFEYKFGVEVNKVE